MITEAFKKKPPQINGKSTETYLNMVLHECDLLQRAILGSKRTDFHLEQIRVGILIAWELMPDEVIRNEK